jgi:hypothetical protein
MPHPENQNRVAPASNERPAASGPQAVAQHSDQAQRKDKQLAGGPQGDLHRDSNGSQAKPGAAPGVVAGRPKQGGPRVDTSKQGADKPSKPQLASANVKNKPDDTGKQPNGAKPPVKAKGSESAAKNKAEHVKKPGGKDEKQEHDKQS